MYVRGMENEKLCSYLGTLRSGSHALMSPMSRFFSNTMSEKYFVINLILVGKLGAAPFESSINHGEETLTSHIPIPTSHFKVISFVS